MNGWDVGLPILWSITNPGDQPRIGLILLIVGIVALAAAFIPKAGRGLAAFTGLLGVVIGGLYVIQVIRFWGQDPINAGGRRHPEPRHRHRPLDRPGRRGAAADRSDDPGAPLLTGAA